MPENTNDSGGGFKVVDHRPFASDGTRRGDTIEEKAHDPIPSAARERTAPGPSEPERSLGESSPAFEALVSSLSTTAMFQLGLLPGPEGQQIPIDLAAARQSIEILEMLQVKTRGNLTLTEGQLLDDVLYELRMGFVAIQKRQAPRRK